MRVLVTGASGSVGRRVAELLAERGGAALRLVARDTGRIPRLPGSEAVAADYADGPALDAAFEGVERALVVSGGGPPGERASLHANVFRAAQRAGVSRLVYLSFVGAAPDSAFPMARDHHQSEEALRASGVPHVVLRDNLYLDLLPEMIGVDGVLRGPAGEGRAAFVAREDVAAVAAAVLGMERCDDRYDVTGPEAMGLAEAVGRIAALTGLDLRYEDESVEAARAWRRELGAPDWQVESWIGSYRAIAAGELEHVSDAVERVTRRPPVDLERFVRDDREAFAHLRPASAG